MSWAEHNLELVLTADQSPSLVMQMRTSSECMHHRGGAWAETEIIYEAPARVVMEKGGLRFLSVGLGLGYNEIMLLRLSQQMRLRLQKITCFESCDFLIEYFQKFCREEPLPSEIFMTYQEVFHFAVEHKFRINVQSLLREFPFDFRMALGQKSLPKEKYDCVLYDAFSSKSTPELWSEDFLSEFLQGLGEDCVFTTYASTGALKRALKKNGFQIVPRKGFLGRRESTLAVRGEKYLKSLQGFCGA